MDTRKLQSQVNAFVLSGFKQSKFTVAIYEAMYINSNKFIAHYNRDGFYKARFESRDGLSETLTQLESIKPTDDVKRILKSIPSQYSVEARELIAKAQGGTK